MNGSSIANIANIAKIANIRRSGGQGRTVFL